MRFQYKFTLCHGVLHGKCDFKAGSSHAKSSMYPQNLISSDAFWYPDFMHAILTLMWGHLPDLVYDGVCLGPVYVVRWVGFTENEPQSNRWGGDLRFMALDLSVRFNFISSDVCHDLENVWDIFQCNFTLCHCKIWGIAWEMRFWLPNQACIRKFWYPQMPFDILILCMKYLYWCEAICTI